MSITIVIPTFNEEESVKKIIPAISEVVPHASIVVVDDDSPDGTAQTVKELQHKYKRLFLLVRKGKGGRGSAVIEGFRYAQQKLKPEIYIEMDADLSHDPSELPSIIRLSKPKTVVLASRYVSGSKVVSVPLNRKIMSKCSNFLIHHLLNLPIQDNTNGYRCYRWDAVSVLLQHQFISHGYILLSEAALVLYTHGFSFVEVPSIFRNRTLGSSNTSIAEFMHALTSILRIRSHVFTI